jgi:hypothetical protein
VVGTIPMLCNKYQAERYRAVARQEAQWLGSTFPDYPQTTAQAIKAAEEFCRQDFSAITVIKAVHDLGALMQQLRLTRDKLRQMQGTKQREGLNSMPENRR